MRRNKTGATNKLLQRGYVLLCFCAAGCLGQEYTPSGAAPDEALPVVFEVTDAAASESADSQINEARLLMLSSNYNRAIHLLEGMVQNHPRVLAGWERLGWCYWYAGREKDAIALWERLVVIDPRQYMAYNWLAKAAVLLNDRPAMVKYFEKSLALNPDQIEIRFSYARSLRWVGRREESWRLMEALHKEFPARHDIGVAYARALLDNEQYAEALPLWSKLKEEEPGNIEYQVNETRCLIATSQPPPPLSQVCEWLSDDPTNRLVLEVLADTAEAGDQPEEAWPFLRDLLEIQADPILRKPIRMRLIRLLTRLNSEAPLKYPVGEAIQLMQEQLASDPDSAESMLSLGELYLTDRKPAEAKKLFLDVLQRFNPRNLRAHKDLFETELVQQDYAEARKQLDSIRQFDPLNPYLDYYLALLESARGNFYQAYQALDRLEASGRRGAVAVLLYHALSPNPYSRSAVSTQRFDEQIKALLDAHFEIVTPDRMQAIFQAGNTNAPAAPTNLYVMVTFDDVRRDAMLYGTPVARKYGVTFLQHIPLATILSGNPFHCSWDEMKAYQQTGSWIFGSHCLDAHNLTEINSQHRMGIPLANYKWLPETGVFETPEQYAVRLQAEFAESRKLILAHLGENSQPPFVAYPFGDIGQEGCSSVTDAVPAVLAAAGTAYQMGWIQSSFGFAVNGDNPLLYQRLNVDRTWTGTQLVQRIYENHPVYLARRLRAEVASLEDRLYRARNNIGLLEKTGFPAGPLETTRTKVENRLTRKSRAPVDAEETPQGPFDLDLQNPRLEMKAEGEQDDQNRRKWQILGLAGVKLTPAIGVEGGGGIGSMSQTVTGTNRNGNASGDLTVDERDIGLKGVFNSPNGYSIAGDVMRRQFLDPAGRTYWRFGAEAQVRPLTPVVLSLRFEHDVAPSALAAITNITYNAIFLNGFARLSDWWTLTADGSQYRFSDDNTRTAFGLESIWTLHERSGLFVGGRYGYTTSPEAREDAYWTPYQMHRLLAETGFKGSYLHMQYRLLFRAGIGRQEVRPETQAAYDEDAAYDRLHHIDPGPPPEAKWEPVYHVIASCKTPLGQRWSLQGDVSYSQMPDYSELHGMAGVSLNF